MSGGKTIRVSELSLRVICRIVRLFTSGSRNHTSVRILLLFFFFGRGGAVLSKEKKWSNLLHFNPCGEMPQCHSSPGITGKTLFVVFLKTYFHANKCKFLVNGEKKSASHP